MFDYLNRDTKLCMSLAARPSNIGTRFHNFIYRELGLNYVYKAFTTKDIEGAIRGIRALGIRGSAISMPFKQAVIPLIDEMMPSATAIGSVNTIVNDDGHLRAYNTDYVAVRTLIEGAGIDRASSYALLGSGGMAKAVGHALVDAGFTNGTIIARNQGTGGALAKALGLAWAPDLGNLRPAFLLNVTPIGMAGGAEADDLAFPRAAVEAASAVFDAVALPIETPLVRLARTLGKTVVDGGAVITLQAVEQFALYTGVRPEADLVARAQAFAQGG